MIANHGLVITDERAAVLYTGISEADGRWRLEERARLRNVHEDEHEHGRPSLLGRGAVTGPQRLKTGPQHLVSAGHTDAEESRRFAREIMKWLDDSEVRFGLQRTTLFAPPRLLGLLRIEQGRSRLDLREGELSYLSASQLARRPAIAEAVGIAPGAAGSEAMR